MKKGGRPPPFFIAAARFFIAPAVKACGALPLNDHFQAAAHRFTDFNLLAGEEPVQSGFHPGFVAGKMRNRHVIRAQNQADRLDGDGLRFADQVHPGEEGLRRLVDLHILDRADAVDELIDRHFRCRDFHGV